MHTDWKLVLDQDFSKITKLDPKIWNVIDAGGGFGNNELQYYSPANIKIENGELVITAKKENCFVYDYTSGKLTTQGKWSIQYGRIEACIKAPKAQQGNWPAFWMLGDNIGQVGWPKCGEIDIMELVNGSESLHAATHCGIDTVCKMRMPMGLNYSESYSVYAAEWEKDKIRFYCDDICFGQSGTDNSSFNQKFHILLNFAIGGNWPGSPNAESTYPQEMRVKYVRAYQRPRRSLISKLRGIK